MRKLILLLATCWLLSITVHSQQIIVTCSGTTCPPATSITVLATPTSITIGGTSILKAIEQTSSGPNNDVTNLCSWSSSNSAILSVNGNTATGVAGGTATANCSLGGIIGAIPVSINVSAVVFNNPVQATCANPCILPQGTNGVSYQGGTYAFVASSLAGGPYTYSVTSGSFAACGVALASGGGLTGTATTGVCTATVKATDGSSNTASLPISLTVVAATACGPPTYPCSNTSTSNLGTVSAPITSGIATGTVNTSNSALGGCTPLAGQACVQYVSGTNFSTSWPTQMVNINGTYYTVVSWNSTTSATIIKISSNPGTLTGVGYTNYSSCTSNCQNTTWYDTSVNPSSVGDCITRISDGTVFDNGKSVGNTTHSGGDNDVYSSINEDLIAVTENGGVQFIIPVTTSGGCLQAAGPAVKAFGGPMGFSSVTDNKFYYLTSNTQLWSALITGCPSACVIGTQTELYDVSGVTGGFTQCPGVNWSTFGTPSTASILGISYNDGRFGWAVSPAGQGHADWVFVYDTTLGCSSADFATGQVWSFTTSGSSSTPALGNISGASTCWGSQGSTGKGIHDTQMTRDGLYMAPSLTIPWLQGGCANSNINNQFSVWQIATLNDTWGYSAADSGVGSYNFGSHNSDGESHIATPYYLGPNVRPTSNLRSITTFLNSTVPNSDQHCSWPHPLNDDSYDWVCASDAQTTTQSSGCTNAAQCPVYYQNFVYAWNPNAVNAAPVLFSHTYSCNPTGSIYAKCAGGTSDSAFGSQYAIGFATAKGNFFCWSSTVFLSLGNDSTGVPRSDLLCEALK